MSKRFKIFVVEDSAEPIFQHEIGDGTLEQLADGSLDLKLTMVGDYTMASNNISGMARLRGFILASLRKD
jgi:hypothetical protein